jgi:hypothetical protein
MKLNINRDRKININTNPNWLSFLGVCLVLLKLFELTAVATWSWWLVLLPFYVGLAIFLGLMFGGAAICGIGYVLLAILSKAETSYNRYKWKNKK